MTGIDDPSLHIDPFTHMIDRACLGVCYSYANYEPSTAQFRVRALGPNPSVAFTYEDSWRLHTGSYIVKPETCRCIGWNLRQTAPWWYRPRGRHSQRNGQLESAIRPALVDERFRPRIRCREVPQED